MVDGDLGKLEVSGVTLGLDREVVLVLEWWSGGSALESGRLTKEERVKALRGEGN